MPSPTPNALTRRRFLAGFAPAIAAMRLESATYNPLLAAQIYVWTQVFQKEKKTLAEGMPEALAGMRRAGYRRVELVSWVLGPDMRRKTLAALKENGLEVPIVYAGGPMHEAALAEKTMAETLALAESLATSGTRFINVNPNPKGRGERKTDTELDVQARYVNQLTEKLRAAGMRLMLHHHDPEMAENAREWRHLLQNTQADLCIDTHWVYRGGQDVMALLGEAGKRVASLHLRNSVQGVWTEDLGDGDIDYAKVAAHLKTIGFAGYLVVELAHEKETRITRGLEENLRLSREYTQRVFGVEA